MRFWICGPASLVTSYMTQEIDKVWSLWKLHSPSLKLWIYLLHWGKLWSANKIMCVKVLYKLQKTVIVITANIFWELSMTRSLYWVLHTTECIWPSEVLISDEESNGTVLRLTTAGCWTGVWRRQPGWGACHLRALGPGSPVCSAPAKTLLCELTSDLSFSPY